MTLWCMRIACWITEGTNMQVKVKVDEPGRRRPKEDENYWLEGEDRGQTGMEQNC